jgi:excisionase family DNA binding protein
MSELLTTAEVAELWGCTQRQVQALCKRGKLKAEMKGKTYLVRRRVAENYKHQAPGRPGRNRTHIASAAKNLSGKKAVTNRRAARS